MAPITFENIQQITYKNKEYDIPIDWEVLMFINPHYKSDELQSVKHHCSERIQDPMFLMETLLPSKNDRTYHGISVTLLAGAFAGYRCRKCGVQCRICEVIPSVLHGNVECPACRALYAQYPQLNDGKLDPKNLMLQP